MSIFFQLVSSQVISLISGKPQKPEKLEKYMIKLINRIGTGDAREEIRPTYKAH